ncbi:MAG: Hsp20/alpha crystallin family protein [Candidatus Bathyarchaeota archaeon]|nr:Hsp20/alpha crystallin family protein [Candidatus Bathyarchaeota archaeon]
MSSYWDDWFKRFRERRGFFFPEIDRMMEDMEKFMSDAFKEMEDTVPRDMVRVRRLPDGSVKREYGPFVYGYSVKIGPDGRPIIREFGNIKPGLGGEGQSPLNLQEQREPLVDIVEEDESVKIIAELPGVAKDDIRLYATERTLTIDVDTPDRKYRKELELPVEVDETSARSTYKNGVLETALTKMKPKGKGAQIKIE